MRLGGFNRLEILRANIFIVFAISTLAFPLVNASTLMYLLVPLTFFLVFAEALDDGSTPFGIESIYIVPLVVSTAFAVSRAPDTSFSVGIASFLLPGITALLRSPVFTLRLTGLFVALPVLEDPLHRLAVIGAVGGYGRVRFPLALLATGVLSGLALLARLALLVALTLSLLPLPVLLLTVLLPLLPATLLALAVALPLIALLATPLAGLLTVRIGSLAWLLVVALALLTRLLAL